MAVLETVRATLSKIFRKVTPKNVLDGNTACRLHRKTPTAYNNKSCWRAVRHPCILSEQWSGSPWDQFLSVLYNDDDIGKRTHEGFEISVESVIFNEHQENRSVRGN
jgi:hypothetical protein